MNKPNITINHRTAVIAIDSIDQHTYPTFLKTKEIPRYQIDRDENGKWLIEFPAEYASRFDSEYSAGVSEMPLPMPEFLFDRQMVAVRVSWFKQRYALFWDAGLGKTLVFLELARQLTKLGKKCLIVSPLNVIAQTMETAEEFYGILLANYHGNKEGFHRWRREKSSLIAMGYLKTPTAHCGKILLSAVKVYHTNTPIAQLRHLMNGSNMLRLQCGWRLCGVTQSFVQCFLCKRMKGGC
jgi:hypothetical protein